MKKMIFAGIASSALLLACGNNKSSGSSHNGDTSTHSAEGGHTTASSPGTEQTGNNNTTSTASGSAAFMMDIMNMNMQDMKALPSTNNPDNDFAALMKIHHMGALEMAQAELSQGQDPQLKSMAQKMIDAQQQEIAELNTFLSGHNAHGGGDAFYKDVMKGMSNMKMDMNHTRSVDQQFALMMILHHKGAIDMAKAYLKSGAHEEKLKTMANKTIIDQQKEIKELQAWLDKKKGAA